MKSLSTKQRSWYMTVVLLLITFSANAEIMWTFDVGGMYKKKWNTATEKNDFFNAEIDHVYGGNGAAFNLFVGLGLQIPVSQNIPLSIETGLRYRRDWLQYKRIETDETDFRLFEALNMAEEWGNLLELPIKINYKLETSDLCSFDFAIGPRIAYNFTPAELYRYGSYELNKETGEIERSFYQTAPKKNNAVIVDIEPSVTFNIRAFRVGLQGALPIYNKAQNYTWIGATIGFSFKTGVWSKIGQGAMVAGMVMGTVAEGYVNSQSEYVSGGSAYGDSDDLDSGGNNAGSNWEKMYWHWEKRAKEAYESLTNHSMSASNFNRRKRILRNAQKEMRSARSKARKNGVTIEKSYYEDVVVKPL